MFQVEVRNGNTDMNILKAMQTSKEITPAESKI